MTSTSSSISFPAQAAGGVGVRNKVETTGASMLETSSALLAEALAGNAVRPTAQSEVTLAQAYMHHGILDKASEHFTAATRIDPREGAAWDGLARVWREWGFPQFGLGDAYRAVYASPTSPAARNTLGTMLQALGKGADARARFAQAAALDPGAAYALNNLCYSWLAESNVEAAATECRRAIAIDPSHTAARLNLAFALDMAARRPSEESSETRAGSPEAGRAGRGRQP